MVTGTDPSEDILICLALSYPVTTETLQCCHIMYSWKLSGAFQEQRLGSLAYCKSASQNLSVQTNKYPKDTCLDRRCTGR
jgi:hypothetical protein